MSFLNCFFRNNLFRSFCTRRIIRFSSTISTNMEPEIKKAELADRIVWVDLEMTGLDVSKEQIMEAAVIVTDGDLNIIAEGPNLILKVDDEILDNMGEWCKKHHGESGLTESCRKSSVTLKSGEELMLDFVREHSQAGLAPLAGNSIGADKLFLSTYMPNFMKHLHYRVIDVSTVKELCSRWYPDQFTKAPTKKCSHRALDDIKESIQELKYYRTEIFK